ncbi:MAG: hypothetical protein M3Y28_02945 [Armatimonadota bacterium]|nr:hypothetical protein [Armatimonadota bacterium]
MSMEVPRCIDCGAPLKAVPTWLATAKVSFTCTACPRRSSRARYDAPVEAAAPPAALLADPDLEGDDADESDEEADLELPAEDLGDSKEDVEV